MQTNNNAAARPDKCQICTAEPAASRPQLNNVPCCDACYQMFDWFQRWLVNEAGVEARDVAISTSLVEAHKGDSFSLVELLMEIQDEFGVTVAEGAEARLKTVEDAILFIRSAKVSTSRGAKRRFWARTP